MIPELFDVVSILQQEHIEDFKTELINTMDVPQRTEVKYYGALSGSFAKRTYINHTKAIMVHEITIHTALYVVRILVAIALLLLTGIPCTMRGDCIDTAVAMAMLLAATAWITNYHGITVFIHYLISMCGVLVVYSVTAEFVVYNEACFGVLI